ncbi:MAG: single-stranded DNA-binding protein [Bifidobacteriaceae bacterium]|jgi:single-strand DNA-binding protein|nr:single-stranded DNA-binding protein [Bifidobacteriaceae bacterium]
MNNEIQVTVEGWVARSPQLYGKDEANWVIFRLASTAWWRNSQGDVREAPTTWFDVKVSQKDLIENVMLSLRLGDPVIVAGRLASHLWTDKQGAQRSSMQIAARSVGHALRWGRSTFTRRAADSGPRAAVGQRPDDYRWQTPPGGQSNEESAPRGWDGSDLPPDSLKALSSRAPLADGAGAVIGQPPVGDSLAAGADEADTVDAAEAALETGDPGRVDGLGQGIDEDPLVDEEVADAAFAAVDALATGATGAG